MTTVAQDSTTQFARTNPITPVFEFTEAGKNPKGPDTEPEVTGITTNGWYFHDETWTFAFGPYKTQQEAEEKLCEYAKGL